ncbi:MAG: prolyl oligopeptidase family serine peptidase [Acidobacteriota bacterium]
MSEVMKNPTAREWCAVRILLLAIVCSAGCRRKLPPVPASAPSIKPFEQSVEYQRPAWLPEGGGVLFSGGLPQQFRIYRAALPGGPPTELIRQGACGHVSVHAPSRRLVYSASENGREWCLWTATLDGSSRKQITRGAVHLYPAWSRDGAQIAFWSASDGSIQAISAEGGPIRTVGRGMSGPTWSADGRHLAFVQGDEAAGRAEVVIASTTNATSRVLQSTIATNLPTAILQQMEIGCDWSPDGKTLVYTRLIDGRLQLALIDVAEDRVVRMLPTAGWARTPCWSHDGKRIAYASENTAHPGAIRVVTPAGGDDVAVTNPAELLSARCINYASKDGLEIPSFLYRHSGTARTNLPAIIWLHGGGLAGSTLDRFDPAIQYFVANGFVVLAPNFRVSRGFDPRLARVTSTRDIADDVAAAAEYLSRVEGVDSKRIGVWGGSFGGFGVLAAITLHPELFAAAVEFNGPCDLAELYRESAVYRPALHAILGGSPQQQSDRFRDESPLSHVAQIRCPLLVVHGTADLEIPYRQSEELVKALKRCGKTFDFLVYPGVGHGFFGDVWENAFQNTMVFFKRHLNA